ncbi:MAG TPA: hypothetical protein VJP80_05545 [Candidatus Saccharimonadales bacterium]|nr:hypothetical protein [Candidatus Saccharimonadales bacterium]
MKLQDKARRALYLVAAFALIAVAVGANVIGHASAATQITSRSITMNNSNQGTTGNSYKVTFTAQSSYTAKGIVVDFCDNDPLPGDSCTLPTGFSLTGSPTLDNSASSPNPSGNWSAASSNSNRTLTLTNSTGIALTGGSTTVTFTITSVTNPTTDNHSFYARIFTYTSTSTGYTTGGSGNEGSYQEYGGIALSTGKVINITAKVQETLSFCVYNTTCGDNPSFTIGHTAGTATIIDSSAVDTATAKFSISTNANGGVAVRMKGDTLKSGSNSIAPVNPAGAITAGTANFGFYISTSGTNITADNSYGTSSSNYQLITTGGGAGDVTTTYGGQFAHLTQPTTNSVTTLTFGATASPTTPAGTYTAAEQLIATGTF